MGPPDRPEADKMNDNDNGDGSKENVDPLMQELQVNDQWILWIVSYNCN